MNQKQQFRAIIEKVIHENGDFAPWLKANINTVLEEFDNREEAGTFHGVYKFLEEVTTRAQDKGDFFSGYDFHEIDSLQMARETHVSQTIELKLFVDGKEIDPGRTSIGGPPVWEQNVNLPVCPECDRNMTLVFQLDSLEQLANNQMEGINISRDDYAFGDVGIVRFFRCIDCNKFDANWECG